jgi:hypothetical protein
MQLPLFTPPRIAADPSEPVGVTWVFAKDDDQLRVTQIDDGRRLLVRYDDGTTRERRFDTYEALLAFQATLDSQLRREGWRLVHVAPDRRQGRDRRSQARDTPDRRRAR